MCDKIKKIDRRYLFIIIKLIIISSIRLDLDKRINYHGIKSLTRITQKYEYLLVCGKKIQ